VSRRSADVTRRPMLSPKRADDQTSVLVMRIEDERGSVLRVCAFGGAKTLGHVTVDRRHIDRHQADFSGSTEGLTVRFHRKVF